MKNTLKAIAKTVGLTILVLITFKVIDIALAGMSSASDFGFYGGLVLIACVASAWAIPIYRVLQKHRDKNRLAPLVAVIALMALNAGCATRIGPGHVGIEVDLAGSQRGVQDFTLKTGWVFYNPFVTSVVEYPTFVQTAKWTRDLNEGKPINEEITFTNKDSMLIAADISLSYSLRPDRVPNFYVKFRNDDIDGFTHGFLRNVARDMFNETAGKFGIEQIMGDNGPFLAEVRKRLQDQVDPIGVVIEQFGFIGAPRPPQGVVDSINA